MWFTEYGSWSFTVTLDLFLEKLVLTPIGLRPVVIYYAYRS